jgi:hypothetical protein
MRWADNLTNLCADCLEVRPPHPGTIKTCPGLHNNNFSFLFPVNVLYVPTDMFLDLLIFQLHWTVLTWETSFHFFFALTEYGTLNTYFMRWMKVKYSFLGL